MITKPKIKRAPSGDFRNRHKKHLQIRKRPNINYNESSIYLTLTIDQSQKYNEKDVKNIKIVDYFTQGRRLGQNNNAYRMNEINSNISGQVACQSENIQPDYTMFNEGNDLKSGLIDITKAYDYMNQMEDLRKHPNKKILNSDLPKDNQAKKPPRDSIDLVPSNQIVQRTSQGQKWSRILEYMKKNPSALMQAIPSPRQNEKMKDPPLANFNSLKEQLNNIPKPLNKKEAATRRHNIFNTEPEKEAS